MYKLARGALLDLLIADPELGVLFDRWKLETNFHERCLSVVSTFDRAAKLMALESRLEVLTGGSRPPWRCVQDGVDREAIHREIQSLISQATFEGETILAEIRLGPASRYLQELVELVRDHWRIRWAWIASDLFQTWLVEFAGSLLSVNLRITFELEPPYTLAPAPKIDFHFKTEDGESPVDALRRFQHDAETHVLEPLTTQVVPLPSGRITGQETVSRYVEWWYRFNVLHHSIRSIAGKQDNQRSLIRHGIDQAEHWLSASDCIWRLEQTI